MSITNEIKAWTKICEVAQNQLDKYPTSYEEDEKVDDLECDVSLHFHFFPSHWCNRR